MQSRKEPHDASLKNVALYPGTFDGLTNGHLDIIRRASRLFDKLIVGVANAVDKKTVFTVSERVKMLKAVTRRFPNVEIAEFQGLTVDLAQKHGARCIIRGLRAVSDFEFELQMAHMNRRLNHRVETVFLVPDTEFSFISSSAVKNVLRSGGNISHLVPAIVEKQLRSRLGCPAQSSPKCRGNLK